MELTKVLVLVAAGWAISQTLPVQVLNNTPNENETAFERILTMNKGIAGQLLEGDIAPRPAPSRGVIVCSNCLWNALENGTVLVPYEFEDTFTEKEKNGIKYCLKEFEILTCVKFVERKTERDYVGIKSASGCWSNIGRIGGEQSVSLNKGGCLIIGAVQHEMMHALGFYHEQSRSDRDNYVDIIWQNINPDFTGNFNVERTHNLGLPYDYGSVMHYPRNAFRIKGSGNTIIPKPNPNVAIGQRNGMSSLDVKKLNTAYKCNICRTKLTQFDSGSFSTDNIIFGPDNTCVWLIQAQSYRKVYLEFSDVNIPQSAGCSVSYLKMYDGENRDASPMLQQACGFTNIPTKLSSGNNVLMELVSNQKPSKSKFKVIYKEVDVGSSFTTDDSFVMSPYFPNQYLSNIDAINTIIAPSGKKVSLEFDTMELVYCKFTCSCICDYITIIDGPSISGRVMGKFCGFALPRPMVSTQNIVIILFHTDSKGAASGFKVKYHFVN
ncbi:hatching enzyme 1.2-like [Pelobates fuscus]|uniref:hatching enzyme 1.2-like n=1 Tax=Pelobates fuscus TaxID=191477 RepID=UPI002FE4A098